MSGLVKYVRRDLRRKRCPECGREWTRAASGVRFCAYAEDHVSGSPIFERVPPGRGR